MSFSIEDINTDLFLVENAEEETLEVELPKVIGQEQFHIYLPYASYDKPGAVYFPDTKYFKVNKGAVDFDLDELRSDISLGLVDEEFSSESVRPLQNKVITQKFEDVDTLFDSVDKSFDDVDESLSDLNSKLQKNNLINTIGVATSTTDGLLSSTDKKFIDVTKALLGEESGDSDAFVNTVREVLSVFNEYPEGVTLTNALAGKIDVSEKGVWGGVVPMPSSGYPAGNSKVPSVRGDGLIVFRTVTIGTPAYGNLAGYDTDRCLVAQDAKKDLHVVNLRTLNKKIKEVNAFDSSGDYPNIKAGKLSSAGLKVVDSTSCPTFFSGLYLAIFNFTNGGYGCSMVYRPSIISRACLGTVCEQGSVQYQAIISHTDNDLRVQSLDGQSSPMTISYVFKLI